ncbi:MAG: gluconate 5-dehydrogenase [Lachnospiraceae bacterium]|nr:gluconate 5-dehydrogenase [Lachnospiraceae bacterium]
MSSILDRFKLDGKVAWITGASSGLGLEIAKAYSEAGAKIVFNDVNKELVKKGLEAYKKLGIDVYGAACDVTNEKQVTAFVKAAGEKAGPIDILVNNASIIRRVPLSEMTVEQWESVVSTDLTGPFICSKAVIPSMIERGGGKIINMLSVMSELGRETVSAYSAAKGGLRMLTKNICAEYGMHNIQCNAIGPGYMASDATEPLTRKKKDGSLHPYDNFIISRTPARRWGKAEDITGLAVFLASGSSDFINGQIIYADGGLLAYMGKDPMEKD